VPEDLIDIEKHTAAAAGWGEEAFAEHWQAYIDDLAAADEIKLPIERVQFEAEQSPMYQEVAAKWAGMTGEERAAAWPKLLEAVPEALASMSPICVRCGHCCRQGSPSLHTEDLDLLREEKIPWDVLVTLRKGEPVRGLDSDKPFYLQEERIKLRERPGTGECVFFDAAEASCTIYADRPIQCRAQACWDEEEAKLILNEPLLTRRHIFADVKAFLELLEEHDARCSFDKMREVFEELKQTEGKTVDQVIELLAFDEHFREFVCEKMKIPAGIVDMVFGRSLSDRVRLFGFKVEKSADDTRTLVVDEE